MQLTSIRVLLEDQMAKAESAPRLQREEICASYLKALGDPIRLQIIRALQGGALSVSDVALLLELDMGNVSHHLRVLFHAKLVVTEREGKYVYYGLNPNFLCAQTATKSLDFGCCRLDLQE